MLWLSDDFGQDQRVQQLYDEIIYQGHQAIIKHYYEYDDKVLNKINNKQPVIIHGSLQFAKMILNMNLDFIPGVYGFDFSKYSIETCFNKYTINCLNYDAKLCILEEFLNEYIVTSDSIFIRPNMSDKAFTGFVLNSDTYDKWKKEIDVYETPLDTEIYIGEAYQLTREWRCIICNGEILTSTLYRQFGKVVRIDDDSNIKLHNYVKEMLQLYQPDDVFVLDICECNNELYVLELGMFSCCGLYTKHIASVVKTISMHNN